MVHRGYKSISTPLLCHEMRVRTKSGHFMRARKWEGVMPLPSKFPPKISKNFIMRKKMMGVASILPTFPPSWNVTSGPTHPFFNCNEIFKNSNPEIPPQKLPQLPQITPPGFICTISFTKSLKFIPFCKFQVIYLFLIFFCTKCLSCAFAKNCSNETFFLVESVQICALHWYFVSKNGSTYSEIKLF